MKMLISTTSTRNDYSILGILSLLIGLINIIISITIYWALWAYVNDKFGELIILQFKILNVGSILELITKPLGVMIGTIGLFQKNKKKNIAIIGISINIVTIIWTIALWFEVMI